MQSEGASSTDGFCVTETPRFGGAFFPGHNMNKEKYVIDFETRSVADLREIGLYNYARDKTTDVLCLGWKHIDPPSQTFVRGPADVPDFILRHAERGGTFIAHNAPFEIEIWNNVCALKYGWPRVKPEQFICTMAMAYAMGLPGALAEAAAAVGLDAQKDMKGHRLMLQMARPRTLDPLTWWDDEDRTNRLFSYCGTDVDTEAELYDRLQDLNPRERKIWLIDQKINARGMCVDTTLAAKAIEVCRETSEEFKKHIYTLTEGAVSTPSEVKRLTDWVREQGVNIPSLSKADVLDALTETELPVKVEKALRIRKEAGKTSVSKLDKMIETAGRDHRLRGMYQYHGAATGRWAGRAVQLQNFPRPRYGMGDMEISEIIELVMRGDVRTLDVMYGPTLDAVADMLRGCLRAAPGKVLAVADYSAIESRGLAWLSGNQPKLDVFWSHGKIYEHVAAGIFGVHISEVDEHKRFIGKVAELALGYGGGVGAFQQMARAYGLKVTDEQAESIKVGWRESNPQTVRYWYALNDAAMAAVDNPGMTTYAGSGAAQIAWKVQGSFLWCRLPSGRLLCYPYPKIEEVETPWGAMKDALTYMYVDSFSKKWVRGSTHGGVLAENITQAICRDQMADAMVRCEEEDEFPIVLHTHDELCAEKDAGFSDIKAFEDLISITEPWAKGFPVKAKGWIGERYRK